MASIPRILHTAARVSTLRAVISLALCVAPASAGAQDAWQPSFLDTSCAAADAPSGYPTTGGQQGELLRLPAVHDADSGQSAYLDPSVRPADYVPDTYDATAEAPADAQFYTMDELRSEMKKLAWTKGDFTIVPYGQLWGSAFYGSSRWAPGQFILYVPSPEGLTGEGEDSFVIDTRRTRLGMNITGPDVPLFGCAKSGAQVEVDFMGFAGNVVGGSVVPNSENFAGVLMRHAFAELKTDNWRLLAGQTWDVISPLNPGMLTYAVGWAGGNIGFRRMQIRGERYLHFSDSCLVTVQGAMLQDVVADLPNLAENSNWPVLAGRVALSLGQANNGVRPFTIGLSSHVGEQGWDFPDADDYRLPTWSVCADAKYIVTPRLGIQGEFFTGENLATFLGGINQGINPLTRRTIQSTGGWIDLWYDWTPRLHSHLGCGIDNPLNTDVQTRGRTENSFLFGNVSFDVTKKLVLGLEVSHWKTEYQDLAPGETVLFEFIGSYGF